MKFIKLYEGFDQEDYYVKITEEEFLELILDMDNKERFNTKEINFIYMNFNNTNYIEYYPLRAIEDKAYKVSIRPKNNVEKTYDPKLSWDDLVIRETKFHNTITKLKDSYFIVSIITVKLVNTDTMELYKCDQFEGLVKLLKE